MNLTVWRIKVERYRDNTCRHPIKEHMVRSDQSNICDKLFHWHCCAYRLLPYGGHLWLDGCDKKSQLQVEKSNTRWHTPTFSLYNTNMHFQVNKAFTFIFLCFSILSMANPLASFPRDNVVENGLEARQGGVPADSDLIIGGEQSSSIHWHHTPQCTNMIPQPSST